MLNRISSPASQNLVSRPWLNNLHPKSICFVRQRFCLWRPIKLDAMDTKRLLWARDGAIKLKRRGCPRLVHKNPMSGWTIVLVGCWLGGQVSPSNGHQGCSGRQLVGTTMTPHQTTPLGFNHTCLYTTSTHQVQRNPAIITTSNHKNTEQYWHFEEHLVHYASLTCPQRPLDIWGDQFSDSNFYHLTSAGGLDSIYP